jgi:hypothetical protein
MERQMNYFLASMFFFAGVLQIATIHHPALKYCMLAKAGKRILAAGLLVGAIVLLYFDNSNVPVYSGSLALILMIMGLVFAVSERLVHPQDYTLMEKRHDDFTSDMDNQ